MFALVVSSLVLAAPPCLSRDACRAACSAGESLGCRRLGRALADGWGGPADTVGADAAWAKACAAGDLLSCTARLSGPAPRPLLDKVIAACEAGDGDACVAAASISDPDTADRMNVQGCKLGLKQACLASGLPNAEQLGTDLRGMRALDERALSRCVKGDDVGCEAIGVLSLAPSEAAPVTAALEPRCGAGWPRACRALGRVAFVLRDSEGARDGWQRGCDLGDRASCRDLRLAPLTGDFRVTARAERCDTPESPAPPDRLLRLGPTVRGRDLMVYEADAPEKRGQTPTFKVLLVNVLELGDGEARKVRFDAYDATDGCHVQRWANSARVDGKWVLVESRHDKVVLAGRCDQHDDTAAVAALQCHERQLWRLAPLPADPN